MWFQVVEKALNAGCERRKGALWSEPRAFRWPWLALGQEDFKEVKHLLSPPEAVKKWAGHNAGSDLRLAKISKWKGLTISGRWKETCCHFVWLSAGGRAAYDQDGVTCSWAWVYSEIICTPLLQVWVVLAWSNGVVFVLRRRDGSSQGPAVRLFLWIPCHPAPWGQAPRALLGCLAGRESW